MEPTVVDKLEGLFPRGQGLDYTTYTAGMNSSNKEKPVKLLALGKFFNVISPPNSK